MAKNTSNRKVIFFLLLCGILLGSASEMGAKPFRIAQGDTICISFAESQAPVVATATGILGHDLKTVLNTTLVVGTNNSTAQHPCIIAGIDPSLMLGRREAFSLSVSNDGTLTVEGSDPHGLAYGLLELSRLIGISPWEWWADCTPAPQTSFTLKAGYRLQQAPTVEYRGIFINDEDWGLTPWATVREGGKWEHNIGQDHDTSGTWQGKIGPKSYARVFELLLRLRANTLWPAMHYCTRPFFLTEGNREMAARYGIFIGTSHCEPMACNVFGEWDTRGHGEYDYLSNSAEVKRFWEERVVETANQPILYTLGMRGVHDGAMEGAKTIEEQKHVLERVLVDQRDMLARHVNSDVTRVPQIFIPYKEVLDIYNAGLEVPEDVTLMWCDDNYGYIHHMPTPSERIRKGGNGVYYHVSYWGRPHDYLWLASFSPALLCQQMTRAYEHKMRKIWILNVGDIKPAEYQTELFLDMAWNGGMDGLSLAQHMEKFLAREFGLKTARKVVPVLQEHYRLAHRCKPEFLGGTRTEESDKKYWSTVRDLTWTEEEIRQRLATYQQLEDKIESISRSVSKPRQDAFFQLVKYPVQAAAEMNKKILLAQLARHGRTSWTDSDLAYDSIEALTKIYNNGIDNNGKWNRLMDFRPRLQTVFDRVSRDSQTAEDSRLLPWEGFVRPDATKKDVRPILLQGADAAKGNVRKWEQLGYDGQAAELTQGETTTWTFKTQTYTDSILVELRLLPTHPINGDKLRIEVSVDGSQPVTADYATHGRSEEWKQNVLRNLAIRRMRLPLSNTKVSHHTLCVKALDEGVIIDQISLIQ